MCSANGIKDQLNSIVPYEIHGELSGGLALRCSERKAMERKKRTNEAYLEE